MEGRSHYKHLIQIQGRRLLTGAQLELLHLNLVSYPIMRYFKRVYNINKNDKETAYQFTRYSVRFENDFEDWYDSFQESMPGLRYTEYFATIFFIVRYFRTKCYFLDNIYFLNWMYVTVFQNTFARCKLRGCSFSQKTAKTYAKNVYLSITLFVSKTNLQRSELLGRTLLVIQF